MVSQVALRASAVRKSVGMEMRREERAVTAVSLAGSTCISAAPVFAAGSGFWAAGRQAGRGVSWAGSTLNMAAPVFAIEEGLLHCSK